MPTGRGCGDDMPEQPAPVERRWSGSRARVAALTVLLALVLGGTGYEILRPGGESLSLAGATQDPLRPTGVDPHNPTLTKVPRLSARDANGPDAVRRPWTLESISPDGRQLTISYQQVHTSTCLQTNGVIVDQSSSRVVVGVVSLFQNSRGGVLVCTGFLDTVQTVITLKAPLGHRPLLHLLESSVQGSP